MLTGQILLQLIVILLVVQLSGYLCKLIGQQWVIGEILAGLALGPSLFGLILPSLSKQIFPASALPTLQTLGDIGLILYMFTLGARLDTHMMLRQSHKAIASSLSSIFLPLCMGATLAFFLYTNFAGAKASPVTFTLLMGTAMAITAFPVLARLLVEKKMIGTKVGTLALSAAAVDDVMAWCLLALVVALIHNQSTVTFALTIGFTVIFVGFMLVVVRPLLIQAERRIHSRRLLLVLTIVLLLLSSFFTNAIGIHPVFGAFLMGLILPRRTIFVEYTRSIDQINGILFLPLFFVFSGLRTSIGLINSPFLWLICLLVLITAIVGKVSGGTLSLRAMGEPWRESFSLGVLMNTRGLVELIVLNIGLDLGVLSPTIFAMLVIMAVVTTMMASPLLHLLGYRTSNQPPTASDLSEQTTLHEEFSDVRVAD